MQMTAAVIVCELHTHAAGLADRCDDVGPGQRPEVHQDRLAGGTDGGPSREPVTVDRDRLCTGFPQSVHDGMQVPVIDLAAVELLGGLGADVGVVAVHPAGSVVDGEHESRAGHGHGSGRELEPGELSGEPGLALLAERRSLCRVDLKLQLGDEPGLAVSMGTAGFDPRTRSLLIVLAPVAGTRSAIADVISRTPIRTPTSTSRGLRCPVARETPDL